MANKIKGEVKMQTIQERVHSIAVLCGGSSSERSVSINSGLGAKEALLEAGFEATLLDPAKKEDLLELINGTYDLAFCACMVVVAKTDASKVFWIQLACHILGLT